MNIEPVAEITAEQENFRIEGLFVRRDPIKPVPEGTIVYKAFRVTSYDADCDGSLMARLENVNEHGQLTGWQVDGIGLSPETTWERK